MPPPPQQEPQQLGLLSVDGRLPWKASEWTDTDDRVRGGASQSYLDISDDGTVARFHGILDIDTLGGAGFASQRTKTETQTWDLSQYEGLRLTVIKADPKRYTITLRDELLPQDPDTGREQSTISWEYDFEIKDDKDDKNTCEETIIKIHWKDFKPTYRGRPKEDAKKLDTKKIRRFSLLMRSFFAQQKGAFSIELGTLQFFKNEDSNEASSGGLKNEDDGYSSKEVEFPHPYTDDVDVHSGSSTLDEKTNTTHMQVVGEAPGILERLFEAWTQCIRLR